MKKWMTIILIVLIILSGCSSKSAQSVDGAVREPVHEGGAAQDMSEDSMPSQPAPEPEEPAGGFAKPPYEGAKIIRTLNYTLRTSEYDADVKFIHQLAEELGGYVENSYEYASGVYGESLRSLSLQLRIPSLRLGEFQTRFEADRTLNGKQLSQSDVTTTYTDTEARIKNLETRIKRYREMLSEAETMTDIIEIERALSEATYELESYESTKKDLDSRIDFSQVSIEMSEVSDPLQVKAKDSFFQRLQEGFVSGINGFIAGVQGIVIFLASNFLWLILLAVLVVLGRKLLHLRKPHLPRKNRMNPPKESEKEE